MVECESEAFTVYIQNHRVLIDTWWNVNLTRSSKKKDGNSVLIDTWWNVNIIDTSKMTLNDIVLIDTWWNVNIKSSVVALQ